MNKYKKRTLKEKILKKIKWMSNINLIKLIALKNIMKSKILIKIICNNKIHS